MDAERKLQLLKDLVDGLCAERGMQMHEDLDANGLWDAFRALVNTRPVWPMDATWLDTQDELLRGMIEEVGIQRLDAIEDFPGCNGMRLWRGDITTLEVDAIVNAANSQMLGCWVPGHYCIDNAIHTFAGIQLRAACDQIMQIQGHEEPTGCAKITEAFNLPSRYVIHTVGPVANGRPTPQHREQLASSYRSCLDLAAENELTSIAFCCISTGVFGFPQEDAGRIAIATTRQWLETHGSKMTVVFNVFSEKDYKIYSRRLADEDHS